MLPVHITYFNVSAEQEWNNKKGSFVDLAYEVDIQDLPEQLRAFDYLENILFRMEWKEFLDGDEYLITSHELSPFPEKIILIGNEDKIVGRRKCFLDREKFLAWESKFYNLSNLLCRVSLTPVLASTRKSIAMDRQIGYYRLIATTEGSPPLSSVTDSVTY
ncbi:hypothetical protein [Rhizobium brockwellii]|uniref:hypothetical protein n=1 Tax=Rhizobium brockwellii TaxID=3019932 RepID=UPI00052308F1|nr:hypothetical protein [Rhizobium brockwellii]KPN23481.1 hypothetical protein KS05_28175 [Rhizobium brockwellii]QJX09037.1 hypothetical protein RLCC275e_29045 [Rhizobium brockwellii]